MSIAEAKTGETEPRGASQAALESHYDLSNDFFRLWLGPTMSYTSALWSEGEDSLEAAQRRKLDYHCEQVQVRGVARVLDVGCGWGQLPKALVEDYGVGHVTGITMNQSHIDWIDAYGLPNVDIRRGDWGDFEADEPYDRVFAWGVIEHAAKPDLTDEQKTAAYRRFLTRCWESLRPGGWMSLQTITYENSRREDLNDFIIDEIFPESELPTIADIAKASEHLFEVRSLVNHREHYARTLRAWRDRLKENRGAAADMVGEEVVAKYVKYLNLFIVGFEFGTMNLSRWALQRIDQPRGRHGDTGSG